MAKAYSTIGTTLNYGSTAANLTELCKIKSYPDMGGAPSMLETTDLTDEMQTFVPGVKELPDGLEFTANFTPESYASVEATADTPGYYSLVFGSSGQDGYGVFTFQGQHSVYISGGDVNAVREMVITISPSSEITFATTSKP